MSEAASRDPQAPESGAEHSLELKVTESLGKDVGRGLARLDPEDIERLGASVGDLVIIEGERSTPAKIMPAYPDARGKRSVQIDGIVRRNARTSLDEIVRVHKVGGKPARKIVLAPAGASSRLGKGKDARYVGKLLEGLPLTEGDILRATLFGSRYQDFEVARTHPQGVVAIHPDTQLEILPHAGERPRGTGISYEDLGGLGKEIRRVREMIELPLRHPQVFERLGIEAPKGVLLHGPPGCGKTLIARAVAHETDAHFKNLSGPEIMHKLYGESEAHLRKVFEEATARAPSIIFLDEIDAIAPKREELGGEKQVERRVVAQLLALMDGLESRGQVVVIGATNIPNVLDPALRRPGRFDREIEIGIPDRDGRMQILQIHTRGMPLANDVDLERLASITHGFVGADLEALAREAAMVTLRPIMNRLELDTEDLPYEEILELEVTMDHFLEALLEVEPSAIREVFVEVPEVSWDDVGGLQEVKRELMESIEWPLRHADAFRRVGLRSPKGILLYGSPGTGKTLLAKAVATASGTNFISVKGPALLSKYVGESERGIREVFRKARQAAPCIVFFDEIDAVVPVRGGSDSSQVTERVLSQLLTEMDGIEELKGVIVLAATNRLDIIDPALLRPGRFDLLLELPLPDLSARAEILAIHTRGRPLEDDVDLAETARATESFAGADLEDLCRRAALGAVREHIDERSGGAGEEIAALKIRTRHFQAALQEKLQGLG